MIGFLTLVWAFIFVLILHHDDHNFPNRDTKGKMIVFWVAVFWPIVCLSYTLLVFYALVFRIIWVIFWTFVYFIFYVVEKFENRRIA